MSDRSGHTQTLSDVLETIQNFSDSISSTIDAWEAFRKTQLHFFVPEGHSNDKPAYSRLLGSTIQTWESLKGCAVFCSLNEQSSSPELRM
jgi:hypothetical protein